MKSITESDSLRQLIVRPRCIVSDTIKTIDLLGSLVSNGTSAALTCIRVETELKFNKDCCNENNELYTALFTRMYTDREHRYKQ